jgi:hypothetical protein
MERSLLQYDAELCEMNRWADGEEPEGEQKCIIRTAFTARSKTIGPLQ